MPPVPGTADTDGVKRVVSSVVVLLLGIGMVVLGVGAAQAATSDGTRDSAFAPVGIDGFEVYASVLDAQGRLVVGGDFISAEGVSRGNIARYLPDGTLDSTFATGAGFDGPVFSLAVDSSGDVLVGGYFSTYDGSAAPSIARLTPTGALDTTFATGTGFSNVVLSLAVDSSGGIIAGGEFAGYDGSTVSRIARLTPTGALDTTFATGTGFDSSVHSLAVDSSDAVVVGGDFTDYDGSTVSRIARLTPTGALDTTLVTGTGFNYAVDVVLVDGSGNVLATGDFNTYDGAWAGLVIRLSSPVSSSYHANGGTGTAPATQTTLSGRSVVVPAGTGLTRPGYTLTGWNTAADGSGTAVAPGASRTLTAPTSTLYAQWTLVPAVAAPTTPTGGTGVGGTSSLAATGDDDAVPLTALGGALLLAGTGAVLAGRRRTT